MEVVQQMKASVVGGACVAVKSVSVFPDLAPCSTKVIFPSQRRAKLVLTEFGASCRAGLASLPQFELYVISAMLVLATA